MGQSDVETLLAMDLAMGGDDWTPTPHGEWLAHVLAETDVVRGLDVLELGAGVGNHTILLVRKGARRVVATEVHPDLLATTRANVERNCGTDAPVEYRVADWVRTDGTFDVVVTNPPFCKSGKQNRRYFIDALILDAHKLLRSGGSLVFVQSSMADVGKSKRRLEENGFRVEELGRTRGEFRDYYFEDPTFMEEIRRVPDGFEKEGDTFFETLVVLRGILRPFTPPEGAHVVID